ncbi:MAG: glutathione S-transferase N-terminal domain-containing protein [Kofleriaceae bacterium]
MKVYGHPWSVNTRKVLHTLAEKGHKADLVLVDVPTGEHKQAEHVARHPFGKVPVLEVDEFVLYETRAINAYLDQELSGPPLQPQGARERARVDQWINIADSYFIPHAHPTIVEAVFRKFLGGEQDRSAIEAGRAGMVPALDAADAWLRDHAYFGSSMFSLADLHWMPYLEYLTKCGEGSPLQQRAHLSSWWERVSARPAWQQVARTGPQPYEPNVSIDVIQKMYR